MNKTLYCILLLLFIFVCTKRVRYPRVDGGDVYNTDGTIEKYPQFDQSYFDIKVYPQLDIVTKNFKIILQELQELKHKDPKLWHEWIAGQLQVFPFYFFGKWASKGKQLCPKTSDLLNNIPGLKTAAFSLLKPQQQIQPHKGWGDLANNILRCHFGLQVPENCGCVCDNWVIPHKNGEWLVFDDSKMHSSFNFSNEHRIILIVDMDRPKHIPKGTSTVAYKEEVLKFIKSFYDENDINDIKSTLNIEY
jgi:beta-hydroxylase